jgi:hypothetical protein
MCSRILVFGLARPDNCSFFRRFGAPPIVARSDHDLKQQDLILPHTTYQTFTCYLVACRSPYPRGNTARFDLCHFI